MVTTPGAAAKEGSPKRTIGRPFVKGHHTGRPRGIPDKRRLAGAVAAKAIEGKAWDVILALLAARAWRPRFEAARLVLAYSIGAPRMTVEIGGAFGDLAHELSEALAEVRARRAVLDVVVVSQALPAPANGIPAAPADAPSAEDRHSADVPATSDDSRARSAPARTP